MLVIGTVSSSQRDTRIERGAEERVAERPAISPYLDLCACWSRELRMSFGLGEECRQSAKSSKCLFFLSSFFVGFPLRGETGERNRFSKMAGRIGQTAREKMGWSAAHARELAVSK